ncbi:MAG: ion transporter, partial [Mariprofundaceae bacterium]|nr:ion transporter [Mariprofundaceae bacterium]
MDALFLILDFIGIASLLITALNIPLDAESAAAARLLRAFYLMRTLRAFRYIDLQSTMYSPTYGMFISLVILLSFFAQDTMLWVVIIFFSVELAVRAIIMRHMDFESKGERRSEWAFWWIDLIATIVMIPALAVIPHGSALRALRLIRLLRPWSIILRNLKDVVREGQFMQEVNLIVLLLGVLAIAGGVAGHFMLPPFDYTQDGVITDLDNTLFAQIWFAFRLFTDPGNSVLYPPNTSMAIVSVTAVIIGVFIFAFFIGIGAQVVSGLMLKLRNERLNITTHMVMLGWSETAPYIIDKLRTISERHFSRLKLVMLGVGEHAPEGLSKHPWVSYRWGDMQHVDALNRVNLGHARQAIINVPDDVPTSMQLSHSIFSLLAIRKVNPDIYLNYASPTLSKPQLASHHHILQIGWDNTGEYNKPTVVMSHAEVGANMMRNILVYQDFDQVLERLMIPGRTEESALQISEWVGEFTIQNGRAVLGNPKNDRKIDVYTLAYCLLTRGITLIALCDENGHAVPLYSLTGHPSFTTASVLALAIHPRDIHGEMTYMFSRKGSETSAVDSADTHTPLRVRELTRSIKRNTTLKLVITGWVGALPLLLKMLLRDYEHIEVRIIDDITRDEHIDRIVYLRRRIGEMDGAPGRISLDFVRWDFT